ncbi:MAG: penicillin-binding protein 2 [Patescibacteria group bacterium]|nr:penicillin-binding protein 2 [Patescibacteria group bacterium]
MWRYRVVLFFLFTCFFIVIARLFYWQVVKADQLALLGKSQYGQEVTLLPQRGQIETSDGFPIVANKLSYLVFANPKEITDKNREKVSLDLSSILKIDAATISADLNENLLWVPIKQNVSVDAKTEIENLQIPGVGFEKQYSRFYPEASMAAQLVGFVGKDISGNDKGYFGLEGYYNRLLRGEPGIAVQIHDAFGRPILAKANNSSQINGSSLRLSINRAIQFIVEKKLKDGVKKYGAVSGMVGIMNPRTGAIIAMASYPSYDPGSYANYPDSLYANPFISDLYEPGSTFKPIVMSGAIDQGLITPETECPICAGPVSVGGYKIHTWDNKYHKNTTMIKVMQHSDNTGMVFVAQTLGVSRMIDTLNKFGIGETTGIDLQGEIAMPLKPKNLWYPVDLATTGFGQGISVTPIELLDAISAIANNGKRMEPHVVSEILTGNGNTIKIQPKVLDTPISKETAKVMTEILVNTANNGESKWTRIKGYRIAGKTGTASIPIDGHYDPTKTIASFIGYAPADHPKFAMLVILNKPSAAIYGSETAAPLFYAIARDLFIYYHIGPDD